MNNTSKPGAPSARGALIYSIISLLIALGFLVWRIAFHFRQTFSVSQLIFTIAVVALLFLSLLSLWLIRKGLYTEVAFALIYGIGGIGASGANAVRDMGLPFQIIVTFFGVALTMQLLRGTRHLKNGMILSVILGAFCLIFDFIPAPWRASAAIAAETVYGLSAVILLVYAANVVRRFRNLPVRFKIVLSSVGIALISTMAVALAIAISSRSSLTTNAYNNLHQAANSLAADLDNWISENTISIEQEANLPEFREYLSTPKNQRSNSEIENRLNATLNALNSRSQGEITYALFDSHGEIVAGNRTSEIGSRHAEVDYFREPFQTGQPYVSPFHVETASSESSIYFSAPVQTGGQTLGVLRAQYPGQLIQEMVTAVNDLAGAGSHGIVLDEKGIVLGYGHHPEYLYQSLDPLAESVTASDATPFFNVPEFASEIESSAGAVVKIKNTSWKVVFLISEELFLEPVTSQTRVAILVTELVIVLAVLASLWVSNLVTAPIVLLGEVARKILAGELDTRARIETPDEIGDLAQTLNQTTAQLQQTLFDLEERIRERTRSIETAAQIGRQISAHRDISQIVQSVVTQLQEQFNYYHVHVYLLNDDRSFLQMVGGSGQIGKQLLLNQHRIPAGRGLVGRAANGIPVLVANTTEDPNWLPNPLLPDTKSEAAVPIAIGDEILGVIDVQQSFVNGLKSQDVELLQIIANQLAIAVRNAAYLEEISRVSEQQTRLNEISSKISQTKSIEEALAVTVRELGHTFDSNKVTAQIKVSSQKAGQSS